MKALKIDSTIYTEQIISAITDCYATDAAPSNTELLALYSTIGQCICEQGEKAYVVHLAQSLTEQFPQMKGFSPRNLRRMRDFYRTYENQPELMHRAQSLGWTQNTVILDCCETDEQRSFYITLAIEKNLSKLALLKTIELNAFEIALSEEADQNAIATVCPTVGETDTKEAVDTNNTTEKLCVAFVTACDPLRQGNGMPDMKIQYNTSFVGDASHIPPKPLKTKNKQQKRSSCPTQKRSVELLTQLHIYIDRITRHLHLCESHPIGHSPPRWWENLRWTPQNIVFA